MLQTSRTTAKGRVSYRLYGTIAELRKWLRANGCIQQEKTVWMHGTHKLELGSFDKGATFQMDIGNDAPLPLKIAAEAEAHRGTPELRQIICAFISAAHNPD